MKSMFTFTLLSERVLVTDNKIMLMPVNHHMLQIQSYSSEFL